MPDGEYDLGGQNVVVKVQARLASGALAGNSILKMNEGLRTLIAYTGASLSDLWRVTSLNQAIALKIEDDKEV